MPWGRGIFSVWCEAYLKGGVPEIASKKIQALMTSIQKMHCQENSMPWLINQLKPEPNGQCQNSSFD